MVEKRRKFSTYVETQLLLYSNLSVVDAEVIFDNSNWSLTLYKKVKQKKSKIKMKFDYSL